MSGRAGEGERGIPEGHDNCIPYSAGKLDCR